MDAFDAWVNHARAMPIEREIERRGIRLLGKIERCGPCPVCGGEDRFAINTKKQLWNCRGCADGGDVIKLVEHLDGIDFVEACEKLTGKPRPDGNGSAGAVVHKFVAAKFPYEDECGAILFVVERIEFVKSAGGYVLKDGKHKKEFRQKRPDPARPDRWLNNVDGVRTIPYRLPELIQAVAAGQTVFVVEGERKANKLAAWNVPATCNAMGAGKWGLEHSDFLRGADVVLIPDNDDAGFKHVDAVGTALTGTAARVRVLLLPHLPAKGDVIDWIAGGGTREKFDELVALAPDWKPMAAADDAEKADAQKAKAEAEEQRLLDELARLDRPAYERRRNDAARDLGIRRGALDDEVEARRARQQEEAGPAPLFGHWIVEPWPEPVDTDALLLQIQRRLQQHVIFTSPDQAVIVALWILFAWTHEIAAQHSPMLLVTSAEPNSGKTTLVNLIAFLTPRGFPCVETSEATLFRSIERWRPTMIVDEADVILINNEPLRAVVNAGWTRGTVVPRCIGDDNIPQAFPTFCPKVLGMKGRKLPDTTLSRCITVELKRKLSGERAEHFRCLDDAGLGDLRRQAFRWALDNGDTLKDAEPQMPDSFQNRLGDNHRLMFAIADLAGGDWPELARRAAERLAKTVDTTSRGVRLLAAIREIMGTRDAISSVDLLAALTSDDDSEWKEWRAGKALTMKQLSSVLKVYGIAPGQPRINGKQQRGYTRASFEDAWERYL